MAKFFVVSDIHGEANCLFDALNEAGFDENNKEHYLVSLGDEFDRGNSSLDVYKYLKKLSDKNKAIVLTGNHNKFLLDYLTGKSITPFNYLHNGVDETLADFLGRSKPFESWCMVDEMISEPTYGDFARWIEIARKEINEDYPELINWLKTRPYYFETKNYIMTHGAIDTEVKDWKKPHWSRSYLTDWDALTFDDGSFFGKEINNTKKTIVIGHFGTSTLRKMYGYSQNRNPKGNFDILYRNDGRVIAIDGTTNISKKVNVLIIEDEFI